MRVSKEMKKKMLIKQTINSMNKQIQKLEEQKKSYIEAGKEAKMRGLTDQYNLALSGLRMTIAQQKKVHEMKLNFEITSQMKDMSKMTAEFLNGMGSISKDMMKLTKDADFKKVAKQFNEAMMGMEMQTEQMEMFMDDTQSAFSSAYSGSESDKKEIEALMSNAAAGASDSIDADIDKELEALKKRMM